MSDDKAFPNFAQGETLVFGFEVTDPDSGNAIDISNWVFTVTIKENLDQLDAEAILQHVQTMPAGGDSAGGIGEIRVPSSLTLGVSPGSYVADMQRKIPGNPPDIKTLIPPTRITVYEPVTKTFS